MSGRVNSRQKIEEKHNSPNMDEKNELQDSPTPDEENVSSEENTNEAPEKGEEVETVSKAEYDKTYSELKRAQERIEKFKAVSTDKEEKVEGEKPVIKSVDNQFDIMADNLAVMRNLNDNELAEMRTQAKELGIHPVNFIKSKAGQSYLKDYRHEQKVAQATPAPTNRSSTQSKAKEYRKMNKQERETNYGFKAWQSRRNQQSE